MVTNDSKLISVIDIGSNTVRMIVFRCSLGEWYRVDNELREAVRLRQGMVDGALSDAAIERALFTLGLFKRLCDSLQVDQIIATATSAVREAVNSELFLDRIAKEVGITLRILSGEQEAYFGVLGVLNEIPFENGFVVDIGGGSAQISEVRHGRFVRGESRKLGALALTERFVRSDPISDQEFNELSKDIAEQLDSIFWLAPTTFPLIGLGGTIRNLAKIEAARNGYPLNTLHGFVLTKDSINQTIDLLRHLPVAKRKKIPGLKSDRADIILAGALVIGQIMERFGHDQLVLSRNGLREGVFFEQFLLDQDVPILENIRQFSPINMARLYQYDVYHVDHVRFLVGRLFDQLAVLHGYGAHERELLDTAALLHDIGLIVSYHKHHKHSETLITNSGLLGFSPREISIIALLCRYHRKGMPSISDYKAVLQSDDLKRVILLSAILRLAEFLERGRNRLVRDIVVHWDEGTVTIDLLASDYPAVEIWESERHALDLLGDALGREVRLVSHL